MSGLLERPGVLAIGAIVLLVVALIGGQALAAASAPPGGVAPTGRVIGQTTFAYMGGLRTFAAAVLWSRLEPLYHGYYDDGRTVDQLVEFLPSMRLVQLLDPQFEQSYYNASFILARRERMDDALEIAREGIRNNPQSGLMLANYTQMLIIQDKTKNLPEMLRLAKQGIGPDIRWTSADDQFEGYGIFRAVFTLAGDTQTAAAIRKAQDALQQSGAGLGFERD